MGIMDILSKDLFPKSEWKHPDPDVRINAVKKLVDNKLLKKIALNDENEEVRFAAVKNLTDQNLLTDVAKGGRKYVGLAAVRKIDDQDFLTYIAENGEDGEVRIAAADKLNDKSVAQNIYAHIATHNHCEARTAAVGRLNDPSLISKIAINNDNEEARKAAVEKITDQETLGLIAYHGRYSDTQIMAADRLDDRSLAEKIYLQIANKISENFSMRKSAIQRLTDDLELTYISKHFHDSDLRQAATEKISILIFKAGVRDLRGIEEKKIERISMSDLGGENERLADKLIELVQRYNALFTTNESLAMEVQKEIKSIGNQLCSNGGHIRMLRVAYRASSWTKEKHVRIRDIELHWDGIGRWKW